MKVAANLSKNSNNTDKNRLKQVILDYQGLNIESVHLVVEQEEKPNDKSLLMLDLDLDESLEHHKKHHHK